MRYALIIRGSLGVGKTTVCQVLAEQLEALYISIDEVLAAHDLDKVVDGRGILAANFIQANELILPDVRAALADGQIVIFDGNFYYREAITHLEDRLPAPVYVFTLRAPLAECIARDSQRVHAYGEDAAAAVYNLVDAVAYGIEIHTAGQSIAQTVAAIRAHFP
jgi:adenylate kinase family enzyme